MKKYIPEHMLTIAASIAPIVITASSYLADTLLGTEGIIGWGGLAVGLVSAGILLNSDAAIWKTKIEEKDNSAELLAKAEAEKNDLSTKLGEIQNQLDSAVTGKLTAEQRLCDLQNRIAEAERKAAEAQPVSAENPISEIPAEPQTLIVEKEVIKEVIKTVETKEDYCGIGFDSYRRAVTAFTAQSLHPAFLIKKELLSIGEKNSEKYVEAVSSALESIIYMSNLEKTSAPLKVESFDLNDLIKECMRKVAVTISEKKIGTLRKGLEMTVNTDRRWLSIAITHILSNAVGHLGHFGKIAVSGRTDEDGVYIVVEDSGNGSDEAELARIFEPGFVTEEERKHSKYPNGMNLFIAKHAIEHIGGEIIAESIRGKGTRIHIKLSD